MPEKEYIEREAAKNSICQYCRDIKPENCKHKDECNVICRLDAIPAAEVRPVVLCKDCKNDCHCMIQDFMEDYGITPDDQNNFFCGYGEKEDKKDDR